MPNLSEELKAFGKGGLKAKEMAGEEVLLEATKGSGAPTNSGKDCVHIWWTVVDGPFKGVVIQKWYTWNPGDDDQAARWMRDMTKLGVTEEWIHETGASFEDCAVKIIGTRIKAIGVWDDTMEWNAMKRMVEVVSLPQAGSGGKVPVGAAKKEAPAATTLSEDDWDADA